MHQVTLFAFVVLILVPGGLAGDPTTDSESKSPGIAEEVSVTILSSNLANGSTVGEWGFSALVEAEGHCILFDAGRHPDTIIRNAEALDVDLSCVSDIVLSHFHFDHTSGVLPLVDMLSGNGSNQIRRVHVAEGFFRPRRIPSQDPSAEANQMIELRSRYVDAGIEFVVHTRPAEIFTGVWVTGNVPRKYEEKNYPDQIKILESDEWVVDDVPESQGLTILTENGSIVILGCGHSGVVNMLTHVQQSISDSPIDALMGGLHLFNATDEVLGWTADKLREIGVKHLMAGHCTGIEPLMRLRTGLNLSRKTAVVGAVGSKFTSGEGISPTAIAM